MSARLQHRAASPRAPSGHAMVKSTAPSAFERIRKNLDGYFAKARDARKRLIDGPYDAKLLHAWRVNLRRITATLKDVAQFSDDDLGDVHAYLRECREATGETRDLDILADETLPHFADKHDKDKASIEAAANALKARQAEAHTLAIAALKQHDLAMPMRALRHWEATLEPPTDNMTRKLAATSIEKHYRQLAKRAGKLDGGQKTLHRLRTSTKKLRYSIELYAHVFPKQASASWLKQLADLQSHLGLAHDRLMGRKLIATAAADDAKAPKPFRRWAKRTAYEASKDAMQSLAKLEHLRHYWRARAN
ncbi:CHAD domain-containing protein [Dyella sp. EPa41]|uniref:CHAD domain-containing protein n=1 Tax=Dyella sp. EPa41 TaxID=1561194 RepID=UPI001915FDC8|nr:CHAD domain-containing protein [Dyella sp. EPa41]